MRNQVISHEAYKKRMGWCFPWVSSHGSDFDFDYHVSFTPEQIADGNIYYNYTIQPNMGAELQGSSISCRRAVTRTASTSR